MLNPISHEYSHWLTIDVTMRATNKQYDVPDKSRVIILSPIYKDK